MINNRFKFRAWDHTNGHIADFDRYGKPEDFWMMATSHGWDIMQCTGLKDKNGKLIYEGDIINNLPGVLGSGRMRVDVVKWDDGSENGKGYEKAEYTPINHIWFKLRTCEIIGNIHESPELMQTEN